MMYVLLQFSRKCRSAHLCVVGRSLPGGSYAPVVTYLVYIYSVGAVIFFEPCSIECFPSTSQKMFFSTTVGFRILILTFLFSWFVSQYVWWQVIPFYLQMNLICFAWP